MIITEKLAVIEREFHADENEALFSAARCRHPALVEHESIDSVLAVLADKSRRRNAEKDAITRALVCEHQEHPHPFWSALLLLAYWPMLCRLCGRIRSNESDPNERFQLAMTAFIEVISSIPPQRPWLCLSLRRETERRVFRHLGRERKIHRVVCSVHALDDNQHEAALARLFHSGVAWPAIRSAGVRDGLESDEQAICAAYLAEHAGAVLSPEDLELVTATLVRQQSLTDYVRHHYPDLDDISRQRLYQRLKRRHSRALAKLRELLADRWEHLKATKAEAEAWPLPVAASR